jgi:Ca-activated chloride channel homolog
MKRIGRSKPGIRALTAFLLLFVVLSAGLKAQDEEDNEPLKVETLLFTIPLTVSDKKGTHIAGLKKENFTIYEDGLAQSIELFLNEDAPMNVAILLDTSYSTKDVLDKIQKAARDFIKILRPEDRAVIVSFDERTIFLSKLESDRKILSGAMERVRVSSVNGSDMYDAISRVTNNYFAALKGRKAIIALTDGMVTGRGTSAQQTLDALQKSDTFFYPVIFKTDSNSARLTKRPVLIEILQIMAEETGGRFYEKDSTKLKEAFQSIAEDLKYQYLLGFYPRNTKTGNRRSNIKITVDRSDFIVRTKKKIEF